MSCFFDGWPGAGKCSGQLVRGHLIPRQLLRREYGYGALLDNGQWRPMRRGEDRYDLKYLNVIDLIDDQRTFVPICGGLTGCSGHHGQLDVSRKLRIPRDLVPVAVEEFAEQFGLTWWLDRTYGQAERRAA